MDKIMKHQSFSSDYKICTDLLQKQSKNLVTAGGLLLKKQSSLDSSKRQIKQLQMNNTNTNDQNNKLQQQNNNLLQSIETSTENTLASKSDMANLVTQIGSSRSTVRLLREEQNRIIKNNTITIDSLNTQLSQHQHQLKETARQLTTQTKHSENLANKNAALLRKLSQQTSASSSSNEVDFLKQKVTQQAKEISNLKKRSAASMSSNSFSSSGSSSLSSSSGSGSSKSRVHSIHGGAQKKSRKNNNVSSHSSKNKNKNKNKNKKSSNNKSNTKNSKNGNNSKRKRSSSNSLAKHVQGR